MSPWIHRSSRGRAALCTGTLLHRDSTGPQCRLFAGESGRGFKGYAGANVIGGVETAKTNRNWSRSDFHDVYMVRSDAETGGKVTWVNATSGQKSRSGRRG